MVSLPTDDVMMEMFCSTITWMVPLDHVLHQVILGVGTPEAMHVRLVGLNWITAWFAGGVVMVGSTGV